LVMALLGTVEKRVCAIGDFQIQIMRKVVSLCYW